MANVFKRNEFSPLPEGARIEEKGGHRTAHWTEAGRARRAEVVTSKGADRIVTGESTAWLGKVRVGKAPHHKWKTVTLFSDKTASERELSKLQTEEDRRAAGVITVEMDQAAKPLAEHVADYLAALKQMGVSEDHHRIASWLLERVISLAGWKRVNDVSADGLRHVIATLNTEGKATNYCNKFISVIKAFMHWMRSNGRVTADPLAGVKRGNAAKGKRTRARRAMSDEEVAALLEAAPIDRRRKYLFAMLSGLRRGELVDLRWGDLKLKSPIPFIQLREDQTKNAKADAVPLHPALVRVLNELEHGAENEKVLGPMPDMKTMARDLLRAGLATATEDPKAGVRIAKGKYVSIADARGRRTDFHSLRHTFKTAVDRTGCTEATSDALTRHGDKTVGDGYRHAELAEMAAALALIADLSPEGIALVAVQKTGTGGRPVAGAHHLAHHAHHGAHQNKGDVRQSPATTGESVASTAPICQSA